MARVANKRVLPGFGLSLGFTLTYLSLIVLIPLSAVFLKAATMAPQEFWNAVTSPRVVASYKLTFGAALLAAVINAFFGLLLAWGLTRYTFPGRKIVDALIDLPFALPTAVAGIALTAIYARNGWMGSLLEPLGIKIAFTPAGVLVALIFIGLPFVVRTVQPVLARSRCGVRGSRCLPRRDALAVLRARRFSDAASGAAHRLRARLRPCGR